MLEFETDADRTYMITTIKIPKGFIANNENFGQKMTEVLTKRNDDKRLPIIKYLDKNGKITPHAAEAITQKSKSTTYRYLSMLAETGYIEVSGNTNNTIYKVCKLR